MTVEYFGSDVETEKVVEALLRDGAAVVREEIRPELADAVQTGSGAFSCSLSVDEPRSRVN